MHLLESKYAQGRMLSGDPNYRTEGENQIQFKYSQTSAEKQYRADERADVTQSGHMPQMQEPFNLRETVTSQPRDSSEP